MAFLQIPRAYAGKKLLPKKISCVRARKFEISLAILPSYHLKAFFDILRQKNDNDNEDENLSYIRFEEFEEFRIIIADKLFACC